MYLYEKFMEEEYVKTIYQSIENNPRIPISHGIHHIKNVINYCKVLSSLFSLSEEEKETLFLAALLHDVAQVFLQPHHAKNGAFIAKEMLENNEAIDPSYIKSVIDVDRVCHIISCHGGKKREEYEDKLAALLILADKLDLTKYRIRERYKKYDFLWFMEDVDKVDLTLENNVLTIIIKTNKDVTFEELNKYKGIDKIPKVMGFFSDRFKLSYLIKVEKMRNIVLG